MQSSFDKVILAHKGITKPLAYSRIQAVFYFFRDKRTKSKPILRYRTSPKLLLFLFGTMWASSPTVVCWRVVGDGDPYGGLLGGLFLFVLVCCRDG